MRQARGRLADSPPSNRPEVALHCYVLDFREIDSTHTALVGGKALGYMTKWRYWGAVLAIDVQGLA